MDKIKEVFFKFIGMACNDVGTIENIKEKKFKQGRMLQLQPMLPANVTTEL